MRGRSLAAVWFSSRKERLNEGSSQAKGIVEDEHNGEISPLGAGSQGRILEEDKPKLTVRHPLEEQHTAQWGGLRMRSLPSVRSDLRCLVY